MTAICGFLYLNKRQDSAASCTRMRDALAMFGPQGGEQWDGSGISLGIQKYRTLPEDIYDRQPLSDDRFCMVADLRLDNRPELAAEFGWAKEDAARRADADFAFAAWQKWGEGSFDKLIGDWALAVWDKQEKALILARDIMGNRPLFWHQGTDENGVPFFAFASMTQGLFALPAIKMAPDPEVLKFYLALAPMRGPDWFFKDIHRVLPGGITTLTSDGTVESREWYDWSRLREVPVTDDAACIAKFRALFDRAVADRLRTTGGIASHLSSGFDSSAVTTTAAKELAKQGKRLAAYTHVPHKNWQTFAPPGRTADEGPIAARTAATCPNIDHHLVDSRDTEIGSDMAATYYYLQTPTPGLCNRIWGREIYRLAAKNGATVSLSAGMGNMTISLTGLEKQQDDLRHGRLVTWVRDMQALKKRGFKISSSLYRSFGPWMPVWLHTLIRRLFHKSIQTLGTCSGLNPDIAESADFQAAMRARGYDPTFRPHVSVRKMAKFVLRRMDQRGIGYNSLLAQYGLDTRDPTTDRRLLEFSLSLPPKMWQRDGQLKWLYRQAFQGRVPDAVMNQKEKGIQGADWPEHMRRSWKNLKLELAPTLEDPDVQKLMDTDFYREMMATPFPKKMNTREHYRYRIKFLRGLSVAHFIRKANMRN